VGCEPSSGTAEIHRLTQPDEIIDHAHIYDMRPASLFELPRQGSYEPALANPVRTLENHFVQAGGVTPDDHPVNYAPSRNAGRGKWLLIILFPIPFGPWWLTINCWQYSAHDVATGTA